MKVRATQRGTYDNVLYEPNLGPKSEFTLHTVVGPDIDPKTKRQIVTNGVPQTRTVTIDEQFAAEWMEKVVDAPKAAKPSTSSTPPAPAPASKPHEHDGNKK